MRKAIALIAATLGVTSVVSAQTIQVNPPWNDENASWNGASTVTLTRIEFEGDFPTGGVGNTVAAYATPPHTLGSGTDRDPYYQVAYGLLLSDSSYFIDVSFMNTREEWILSDFMVADGLLTYSGDGLTSFSTDWPNFQSFQAPEPTMLASCLPALLVLRRSRQSL